MNLQNDIQFIGASISSIGATTPTSFTAGSIVFSNGTTLAQDNANLFWDTVNTSLSIGSNNSATGERVFVIAPSNTKGVLLQRLSTNVNDSCGIGFCVTTGAPAAQGYIALRRTNSPTSSDNVIVVCTKNNGSNVETFTFNNDGTFTITGNILMRTSTALTNGAGASTGTLTNAPAVGNPTKWIPIVDNGTTRYIPAW